MPGWGWANFLLPLFHCFETPQGQFFQYDQAFLSSYYLGVGIFALAIMAAWRVRQRQVWLLAGLTLFSLIMALGENGSLYRWLKNFVPLLGIARYPVKYVFLAAFAVPLLAAYAIRFIDDRVESNRGSWHGGSRANFVLALVRGGGTRSAGGGTASSGYFISWDG